MHHGLFQAAGPTHHSTHHSTHHTTHRHGHVRFVSPDISQSVPNPAALPCLALPFPGCFPGCHSQVPPCIMFLPFHPHHTTTCALLPHRPCHRPACPFSLPYDLMPRRRFASIYELDQVLPDALGQWPHHRQRIKYQARLVSLVFSSFCFLHPLPLSQGWVPQSLLHSSPWQGSVIHTINKWPFADLLTHRYK